MVDMTYKVWFESESEKEEAIRRYKKLKADGSIPWDIYLFSYKENDGTAHKELYIFNR